MFADAARQPAEILLSSAAEAVIRREAIFAVGLIRRTKIKVDGRLVVS
jgi:hypothetical protein